MSMRINTNLEALNAQRNLNATANDFARSVERLSSGLRIHRAADDAAGLAISQKLESQVTGLNQAQRNAQDGISMVQTAEGALAEVHSMLQRIRELSVEASNSTLSRADSKNVLGEMTALTAEINRIATATTFNGKNLLTGSLSSSAAASGMSSITGGVAAPIKAGSLVPGAYTLTATATASSGTASTVGGANGLGVSNNSAGFSAATAIDDKTNGLLTKTGAPTNTVTGLSAVGAGLGGVSTFVAGTLAPDEYLLSVANAGHASSLGGANTSATVTGSTAIDDSVNGLRTTLSGASEIMGNSGGPIDASYVYSWANGIGSGGVFNNPAANSGGSMTGEYWDLETVGGGSSTATAAFRLRDYLAGTIVNLTNTGGVLTDAASGFRLDLSGITGVVNSGDGINVHFNRNTGVDTAPNSSLSLTDALGAQSAISLSAGETFQQVADAINAAAGSGGAQLAATVGANGLLVTNTGASANSATNISIRAQLNTLIGLGFMAPQATPTSGYFNGNDTTSTLSGTGGAPDVASATLTGATSHTVYTLTNTANVWSNAGSGFSIDLSGVTGGMLNPGWAMLAITPSVGVHVPTNTVSGLSAVGAGLGGVSTFVAGTLAPDEYLLSVANAGHASSLGGANTSATVTGSTAIDDSVNGLRTTLSGASEIMGNSGGPIDASYVYSWANGIGSGGVFNNPAANSGGSMTGEYWDLETVGGGSSTATAAFRLRDYLAGTIVNLTNTGGVLTDAASGFRLDLSGITGVVNSGDGINVHFNRNTGVDTAPNSSLSLTDALGAQSAISLSAGETFQQVADAINAAAGSGGAQLAATVGANGLLVTNTGASANSATNISIRAQLNTLIGLGFMAPQATPTSGYFNGNDTTSTLSGTGGAPDVASATLTGATSHTVYTLTNTANVWSNAGSGFSIDLSGVTGGMLNPGWAMLGVDGGPSQSISVTDETSSSACVTLAAGETFQQVIDAINGTGLALHASFANGGIKLASTGTNLAGSISIRGSDDALRGLGFEAANGVAASTGNAVTANGTMGTAASSSGGTAVVTLTGTGSPVTLAYGSGIYSDATSGFSVDFSGVAGGLSSGTATITITGTGATFQIGANAGDSLGVNFEDARTAVLGGFDGAIADFSSAANGTGSTTDAARAMIAATDVAIDDISRIRANFGAIENRLGHTVASVGVASENLNASESRIRDLDVAAEMVAFTKTQILQQAGMAILAQANSAPQDILALLR